MTSNATDIACVRSTAVEDLLDAAWGDNLLTNLGPWTQSIMKQMVTQMGEPYAPVIDGESVTDDSYQMISKNAIRPNTPIINEYATDEGEEFVVDMFILPGQVGRRKEKISFYERLRSTLLKDSQRDEILVTPESFEAMMELMYGTIGSNVDDNEVCDCVE